MNDFIFYPLEIDVVVPSFGGNSSLSLLLPLPSLQLFSVDLTLLTMQPDGVVLYVAASTPSLMDYVLLTLELGRPVLRFNHGSGNTAIASNLVINDGEWHVISLRISTTQGQLIIDNMENTTVLVQGTDSELNIVAPLYIGGVSDPSILPPSANVRTGFIGCIRDLEVNEQSLGIVQDSIAGVDIDHCPEPVCTYVMCQNGATCVEVSSGRFQCTCPPGYLGMFCEAPLPLCDSQPCMFGGLCSESAGQFSCLCSLGQGGMLCMDGELCNVK